MKTQTAFIGMLCMACALPLNAADNEGTRADDTPAAATGAQSDANQSAAKPSDEYANAKSTADEAAQVVQQMKTDPEIRQALAQAKAVFIVPDYGRAALGVGGAGGQGVLVANNNGSWTAPAFYNVGALTLGLAAGVEAGSVAFLLMSDKAIQGFKDKNNFALNGDAGLTVANWSKRGRVSAGDNADVIAWSGTKGLYGDLAVSVSDIMWDNEANTAYYQKSVVANDIITGAVQDPLTSSSLKSEFSALESAPAGGTTDDGTSGTDAR